MPPFEEGDLVFLEGPDGRRHWVRIADGMLKIRSLGTVDGSRFKCLADGSSIDIAGKTFKVFVPGTVDLMESLERGAQVITPKDAAAILMHCDVRPGITVLEVGAGSGGLTTALCAAVGDAGRVYTIELDEANAKRALRNLRRAGLDRRWHYILGDAAEIRPDGPADVLVMDVPVPAAVLRNLDGNLRPGGRVCAYVPNANQLQEAVETMRELGYHGVHAMENIRREMVVHPGGVRPAFDGLGHTGYLAFGRKG
ncbi:MAG: methyltransferase domain-containing protein [Thermoplasmatales archaeon]|nr:methyltransferase domain-containing protein [Thermoplasmatales archaeon]